jgi:beta-phosphoglucomutase-like phosphatase (HAD superfamily)
LAFEACAELANDILESLGIDARYTGPQLLSDFVGQNFRGMVMNLQKRHGFTLKPDELESYVIQEEDRVIATLKRKAEPCVGANEELEKLAQSGKYGMAVVSSSALRRVKASIEKVGQDKFFPKDHIFSAASSLPKPTSKPDPAIYLHACRVLGKNPAECVAVEDSKSGTLSAVRAGIPVMGYVGSYDGEKEQAEMRKLLKETGAMTIMNEWAEFEHCLAEIERLVSDEPEGKLA